VREADVIVTDTWVSMGQEAEKARRIKEFEGFQSTKALSRKRQSRGRAALSPRVSRVEISDAVMESDRALVFQERRTRLHAQKGIMAVLMGGL
jgi:ornithine carbamoyltransferase